MAAVAAEAKRATRAREATAAARASGGRPPNETCVVCVGPVVEPVELPYEPRVLRGMPDGAAVEGRGAGVPAVPRRAPPGRRVDELRSKGTP